MAQESDGNSGTIITHFPLKEDIVFKQVYKLDQNAESRLGRLDNSDCPFAHSCSVAGKSENGWIGNITEIRSPGSDLYSAVITVKDCYTKTEL